MTQLKYNWLLEKNSIDYTLSIKKLEKYALEVAERKRTPFIWVLRYTSVYTYGASFKYKDILQDLPAPSVKVWRGGGITYHGPDQVIVYPIVPLALFSGDLHAYMRFLENWVSNICHVCGIHTFCIQGKTGVFTNKGKIGFVGVGAKKGVTMHGFSLCISNQGESFFKCIRPCGLDIAVTSLEKEGAVVSWEKICDLIKSTLIYYESAF